MSDYIVAIDAGNGYTNAVKRKGKGLDIIGFPSVRAAVSGDSLGLGKEFELDIPYVDWGKFRYVVGDDVFLSHRAVERHQGAFRYGDEFWLFLISVALGKLLPKKGGSVDLTVFAPPAMFFDAKEGIEERMKSIQHRIGIQFKGDTKPRVFKIDKITVHPEGLGAVAAFALDNQGTAVASDLLDGSVVVLDMGMYTLDVLLMQDGKFNPESLQSATFEGQGIKSHLLDPLVRKVKQAGDDFALITTDTVDACLRQGLETGNYQLQSGASQVDVEALVMRYSERYADYISNSIIDGQFNGLRGIKGMILVGGGATLTSQHLARYYPDKILAYEHHKHVAKLPAIALNAVGGLRLALARQQA